MWYSRDGRPLGSTGPRLEERERERDLGPLGSDSSEISGALEAARLGDQPGYRQVAVTKLKDGRLISTVWLGLDHRFGAGPPLIFESMVFPQQSHQTRYSTEAEAYAGHLMLVMALSGPWPRFSRRRKKANVRLDRDIRKRMDRFARSWPQRQKDWEAARLRASGPGSAPQPGLDALFS